MMRGITCGVTLAPTSVVPALPQAVGPLSATVLDILRSRPVLHGRPMEVPLCEADPYGLDLQLTLYVCYELHYRGFDGVNPRWEWNPALLHVRGRLEEISTLMPLRFKGSVWWVRARLVTHIDTPGLSLVGVRD
jgi:hypothetical protein